MVQLEWKPFIAGKKSRGRDAKHTKIQQKSAARYGWIQRSKALIQEFEKALQQLPEPVESKTFTYDISLFEGTPDQGACLSLY